MACTGELEPSWSEQVHAGRGRGWVQYRRRTAGGSRVRTNEAAYFRGHVSQVTVSGKCVR